MVNQEPNVNRAILGCRIHVALRRTPAPFWGKALEVEEYAGDVG